MAVDLFFFIVKEIASWGIKRLLDTAVRCTRCNHPTVQNITNRSINNQHCENCGNTIPQYVNATKHTINNNKSVVSAHISNIHWPGWRDTYQVYYDLDVLNSKYESVVVKLKLGKFHGSVFHEFQHTLKPVYESTRWNNLWIKIPRTQFPEGSFVFTADLEVFNLWGDLLHSTRELGELGINREEESTCFLTTAACVLNSYIDDCRVLEAARKLRQLYIYRRCQPELFDLLYESASREILMNDHALGILKKIFHTQILTAAMMVETGEYDKAYQLFIDILIKLQGSIPDERGSVTELLSLLNDFMIQQVYDQESG